MSFETFRGSALLAAILAFGVASATHAAIIAPPDGGEANHADIFGHAYGGTFVATPSGFTNGTVVATRVDDADDQIWTTDGFDATAQAVFAHYGQRFGYLLDDTGDDYTNLFDVVDEDFDATGTASNVFIRGEFRFARAGSKGVLASSQDSDNPNGADHMVTYLITGLDFPVPSLVGQVVREPVMMLFFEDLPSNKSDSDFNDLVVEVRGARPIDLNPNVPEPATAALTLAGLAAFATRRTRA